VARGPLYLLTKAYSYVIEYLGAAGFTPYAYYPCDSGDSASPEEGVHLHAAPSELQGVAAALLEVGEHIATAAFIRNLHLHNTKGIFVSWGVPVGRAATSMSTISQPRPCLIFADLGSDEFDRRMPKKPCRISMLQLLPPRDHTCAKIPSKGKPGSDYLY
jgi:hypothetical protein